MRRREFIAGLSSAAVMSSVARARQGERVRRIGVLMNTALDHPEGKARLATFRQALQALGWADGQNASAFSAARRDLIVQLAAQHKLPAIYAARTGGTGLISFGADDIEDHRNAAGYVDRILKGEKPSDLPV